VVRSRAGLCELLMPPDQQSAQRAHRITQHSIVIALACGQHVASAFLSCVSAKPGGRFAPLDGAAGTDALLSSFDSINVMRPPAVTHPVDAPMPLRPFERCNNSSGVFRLQALPKCCDHCIFGCGEPMNQSRPCHFVRPTRRCSSLQCNRMLQGTDMAAASWWHTDQAPRRIGLHCIQGLLNITDVGPHAGDEND
jgi:hypothetical protein